MFRSCLALLLSFAAAPTAGAWGSLGHRVVAELAERQLSDATRAEVRVLLQHETDPTLAGIANWADEARERPEYAWSAPLHYVNIRDTACRYDAARDCAQGRCVVDAIGHYAQRLRDPALPRDTRAEALKFLVHFVGDVHQPLHAGHRADKGGNDFQVSLRRPGRAPEGTNLHGVWDFFLLADGVESFDEFVARLQRGQHASRSQSTRRNDVAGWAEDSCALTDSEDFYPRRPGKLPPDYMARMRPLAEARLGVAAARLAAEIEFALGAPTARR